MKDRELVITRGVVSASLVCSAGLALTLAVKRLSGGWTAVFLGFAACILALRALAAHLYKARPWLETLPA